MKPRIIAVMLVAGVLLTTSTALQANKDQLTLSASFSGPSTVDANDTCTWYGLASGGTPPYSYSWKRGISEVATSQDYMDNTGSSNFWLTFTVTDATSATATSGKQLITVEPDYFHCS